MSAKVLTLEELQESLQTLKAETETIDAALQLSSDKPQEETEEMQAKFDANTEKIAQLAESLSRKEKMADALKAVPRPEPEDEKKASYGEAARAVGAVTYRKNGPYSFFKDVFNATREGDAVAQARLIRHSQEVKAEQYAMTTGSGSGVGFVPPQYLQDEWAALARAGRPLADAIPSRPLPAAGVSFNIPRVTTGSTAAVQASEAGAVQDNSPVSDDVTLTISTIAAKVDMSRQAFDRSEPGLDSVIGQDLAAAYALQVDSEIINGPGSGGRVKGILSATGTNAITYTSGSPTVALLYSKLADGIQQVDTGRFMSANLIAMHPRRWATFLAALDTQSRPLVVPYAPMNPMAQTGAPQAQGFVGSLQGMDVLKDANIPTNLGAGTNQDVVIITRREDLYLFESGAPVVRTYEEVLSGTLQVRIQAFGYIAFTAERYPKATSIVSGTGLTPPSF